MKPKEEIKIIENELINRLCWIPDLDTILPHKVFVEDENEKGELNQVDSRRQWRKSQGC